MKLYAFAFDKCPVARSIVVERSRTLCLCVLRRQELEDSVFVARVWDHTTYRMGPILLHLDTTNLQRQDRYGYSADIEKATAEFSMSVILYHVTMVRSALQERFLPYKQRHEQSTPLAPDLLFADAAPLQVQHYSFFCRFLLRNFLPVLLTMHISRSFIPCESSSEFYYLNDNFGTDGLSIRDEDLTRVQNLVARFDKLNRIGVIRSDFFDQQLQKR